MPRRLVVAVVFALSLPIGSLCAAVPGSDSAKPAEAKQSVYNFSLVDFDGKVVPLSIYKGKVLLIVNLASQSVYKDQIAALNDLQKTYADRGLVVIGIPSADFGGEELKDAAALRKQYGETMHATFPVFASATLHGVNTIPLYSFLCNPKEGVGGGDVHWNYTKFLIGRDGQPLARYEVDLDPADLDFHVTIEKALDGKLTKQVPKKEKEDAGEDDEDEE